MNAYLLPDGKIKVPRRASGDDDLGDAWMTLPATDPEARKWIKWYEDHGQKMPREEE